MFVGINFRGYREIDVFKEMYNSWTMVLSIICACGDVTYRVNNEIQKKKKSALTKNNINETINLILILLILLLLTKSSSD